MPTTDEALLKQFTSGDHSALAKLADRYERPLLGLARGLLCGRDDLARDAIQETWVRVIRFAEGFNGRSSLKTWLYRIAINQCHSLTAMNAKHDSASLKIESSDSATPPPDGPAMEKETSERIRAAVNQLSDERRSILLLCYHDGMTHAEAADVLEIPIGTLKSRLHAALNDLRERLGSEMEI